MPKPLYNPNDPTVAFSYCREYSIYEGMKRRCHSPKNWNYRKYGARGITVCDRWRYGGARVFYQDMGPCPSPAHSIDRIDNDKGYSPENCRWATLAEQMINRKHPGKLLWRLMVLSIDGIVASGIEHASRRGITPNAVRRRLQRGWSLERALMEPSRTIKDSPSVRQMKGCIWPRRKIMSIE